MAASRPPEHVIEHDLLDVDDPDFRWNQIRLRRDEHGALARLLVVEEGRLEYTCRYGTFVLKLGTSGVIEPEEPHHVRVTEPVRFHVVFLRGTRV